MLKQNYRSKLLGLEQLLEEYAKIYASGLSTPFSNTEPINTYWDKTAKQVINTIGGITNN